MPYNKYKTYYIKGEWGGKVCGFCKWFRNWGEFRKKKKGLGGYEYMCKKCEQKYKKEYYLEKKEDIVKQRKEYRIEKKEDISKHRKKYNNSPAQYKVYGPQLTIEEQPRETKDGYLEVKCANSNCRKYFTPTNQQTNNRIQALDGTVQGEMRLYCSEKCKYECSLYRRTKYPKGFKTAPNGTEFPRFIKEEIFKRDKYKCQICGETHRLQAHHIYPGSTHPILSNDVNNGITLCKKCHKKVHKLPGCSLHEIASCSQRIKQDLENKGIDPHEIPDWAVEKYMDKKCLTN